MLDNNFCDRTQKPKAIKETIAKMDLKFKTFCTSKGTVKKSKSSNGLGENITIHRTEKRFLSGIYEEHLKLKINNLREKGAKN